MTTEEKLLKKIRRAQRKWKDIARKGRQEPNLKGVSDALDEYYFISKLKVYCAYLSYTQIINSDTLNYEESDFKFIRTILECKDTLIINTPVFLIYNSIRILFENIQKENDTINKIYTQVNRLIKKHGQIFDRAEKLDLHSFLSNFCIRKINAGEGVYQEKFFLINNEIIKLKYSNKKVKQIALPPTLYKNMVSAAILLKDSPIFATIETTGLPQGKEVNFKDGLNWANQFVEIYRFKIEKKERILYYNYCSSLLSFIQGNYLKSYQQLGKPSHIQSALFNLDLKTLQLRLFYEVNKIDPELLDKDGIQIPMVLEALRGAIRYEKEKRKQLKYQITQYINFEKLYRKLFLFYRNFYGKLYNSEDDNYVMERVVLMDLLTTISFGYKNWFLEKIQEIK